MKNIYPLLFISIFFSSSCSKDFFKPYEDRVVGEWRIAGVNRFGFGGSSSNLPFNEGNILFSEDGSLVYTDQSGAVFQGSWYVRKRQNDNKRIQSLTMSAIDFNNEVVLTESYDDINFRSRNHFVGKIKSGIRTFTTHFRRL